MSGIQIRAIELISPNQLIVMEMDMQKPIMEVLICLLINIFILLKSIKLI